MIVKDLTLNTPVENILFDEVLLSLAQKNVYDQYLRFWESSEVFVVLGRVGRVDDDIKQDAVAADKIKVLRRASGGGTVVQGSGCMNYTLILKKEGDLTDLKKSYEVILNKIILSLQKCDIQAVFQPISDLALTNGLKFSGNAQKRGRTHILHHGTILYNFELSLIEKYLKMPLSMPEYRQERSHLNFVSNIQATKKMIMQNLISQFDHVILSNEISDQEDRELQNLVKIKAQEITLIS